MATMRKGYPDVLGDYIGGGQRWETGGVQFVWRLAPQPVLPGDAVWLFMPTQSEWDVPAMLTVHLELPARQIRPSREPCFQFQSNTEVPLERLEVGELRIPIRIHPETPPGQYTLSVSLKGAPAARGNRVRPSHAEGQVDPQAFPFVEGLALAQTLGVDYQCESRHKFKATLQIASEGTGEGRPLDEVTPIFASYWTEEDWQLQAAAQREVNERKPYLLRQLAPQSIFPALLDETRRRFEDTGLPLRIGEALMITKALVFTIQHFLSRPERQDGLLVPLIQAAQAAELPTADARELICQAGFPRLTLLTAVLGFGLLRQHLGQDPWSLEEQRAVAELLTKRMASPGPLGTEFAYIPMVLAGLLLNRAVVMPGESPSQTLDLARKAAAARGEDLEVVPELPPLLQRLASPKAARPQ